MTHRWLPSRCEVSMPRQAIRGVMPRERSQRRKWGSRSPCRRGACRAACGAAADRRYRRDERLQRETVVGVGRGDGDRDRKSGSVGDEVDLRSVSLAATGRIRSGQQPPLRARTLTESMAKRDQSKVPLGAEFVQDDPVETGPDPVLDRAGKAPVDRRPCQPEQRRNLPPCATRRGHEHNRGQTLTIPRPPTATPCGRAITVSGTTRRNNSHNSSGTSRWARLVVPSAASQTTKGNGV